MFKPTISEKLKENTIKLNNYFSQLKSILQIPEDYSSYGDNEMSIYTFSISVGLMTGVNVYLVAEEDGVFIKVCFTKVDFDIIKIESPSFSVKKSDVLENFYDLSCDINEKTCDDIINVLVDIFDMKYKIENYGRKSKSRPV